MRASWPPMARATTRASVVLPTPGTSSISRWPSASRAQIASSAGLLDLDHRVPHDSEHGTRLIACAHECQCLELVERHPGDIGRRAARKLPPKGVEGPRTASAADDRERRDDADGPLRAHRVEPLGNADDRARRRGCPAPTASAGVPSSAPSRSAGSSGTSPSRGTPSCAARRAPPPSPNGVVRSPQHGQA